MMLRSKSKPMAEEEREPDDSPRLSSSSHSKNKEQSRWVMIVPGKDL